MDTGSTLYCRFHNSYGTELACSDQYPSEDAYATALAQAEAALARFNDENPTAEDLARRQQAIEEQIDQQKRRDLRTRWAASYRKRLALLDELQAAETEAKAINAEAKEFTYDNAKGNGYAGIDQSLITFMPDSFWVFDRMHYAVPVYNDMKRKAEAWLKQWDSSSVNQAA